MRPRRCLIREHRNTSGGYPEHSAAGILQALFDASSIEIDINGSKAVNGLREPICIHDPDFATRPGTVKFANGTNATGLVADYTLPELRAMWLGSAPHKLLTLGEALELIRPTRANLFLESKESDASTLAGINRALTGAGWPAKRVTFLCWAASIAQVKAACPSYASAAYFDIGPSGATATTIGLTTLQSYKALGATGITYWPLTHTKADYDLSAAAGIELAYYANGGTPLDVWDEVDVKGPPSYFMTDALTRNAQVLSYANGWKTVRGVSTDAQLTAALFPGQGWSTSYTSLSDTLGRLTANPKSDLSELRFWWHVPQKSDDGGQSWQDVARANVLAWDRGFEHQQAASDLETIWVRKTSPSQLLRVQARVLPSFLE